MSVNITEKFYEFVNNHKLGSADGESDRRLHEFIIQAHNENRNIEPDLLYEAMESGGFDDELSEKYISAYHIGRAVLKLYDQS